MDKHRTRRWLVASIAAVMLIPLGAAPGLLHAGTAPVTLNFIAADFPEYDAFVNAANRIGKPMGIQIQKNFVNFDDVQKKVLLDFTARNRNWDLVFLYSPWTVSFASKGVLSPIDEFLTTPAARTLVNTKDFVPVTSELTYQGKLWSMPYLSAPWMLGYRKDLYEHAGERQAFKTKHGYDLAPPQTYKQLLDIARFFTRKKGETLAGRTLDDDFYGFVIANKKGFMFNRYQNILVAFGADLLFNPKTMRPTYDSPESLAALKYYTDLYKTMPPGSDNMTGGESTRFAAQGRVSTVLTVLDIMYSIFEDQKTSKVVGKFAYALLPTQMASRPHAMAVDANGIGIYSLSPRKAAAFRLLSETLSTRGLKEVIKEYPEYPAMRLSILNDPQVRGAKPALYQAMSLASTAKMYRFSFPQLPEWPQLVDLAQDAVLAAVNGQKTPEQALADAQAQMVEIFKRAGHIK
ncbi:MAG: extracellular solute-binding protein [Armatimonadota bacterium]|nr:extracellular solute-binding protein [Armatimonadota bacterium]